MLALLVLPGLYLIARFFVFTPAILVERAGFGALGRASQLSKEYRWPIVVTLVLLGLLLIALSFVSQLFVGLMIAGTGGIISYVILQSMMAAVMYSVMAIFSALLYARLREIKEGTGMADLVEVFS